MRDAFPPHAIAIVGLAGRFPDAADLDAFWRNIREGVESLRSFSDAELDEAGVPAALRERPEYVRRGTVLDDAESFDAGYFGISPREAQLIDPQQRIFLECAVEALEHAGYGGGTDHRTVGVYAGASMNTYLLAQLLRDPALVASAGGYQLMLGNDKDFLCTRVSYKLDLRGPSMTVQTACSTSLVAVEVACRALQRGECDMALAGGVSVSFPQGGGYLYEEGMIFSPDGHCRPFDAQAHGTRSGAGAGIVVLKRLADAVEDGDTIHAVIRGAAINNDGAGKAGYTAPSVDGQIEVIATAQALAEVSPRSIGYVEAHGTATPLGDPIEIAALTRAFRAGTSDTGFCRIGSLKANIGHLDAAAGVAGLIKTVLALEHREIPPLVNFRQASPALDLERSPFVASAQAAPWTAGDTPRRAGVSSFGIGGTNAHVVVEEAPVETPRDEHPRQTQLLVLSARTPAALDRATARLAERLGKQPALDLGDVAWTLQAGRAAFTHRRTVVARDCAEAAEALRNPQRAPVMTGKHEGGDRPVAFLFSGQGSQHAGMGAALYREEPAYREVVDRCAELLAPRLGLDLRDVMFSEDTAGLLQETRITQPALFVTELALATLWMRRDVRPSAMLGHSIGEYVAAHLAGVMSLDDALAIVATRGRLMQAMPAGAMAAVHMDATELSPQLRDGVEIAAVNAPSLCSVAGPTDAVQALLARLQQQGVEARALHTSHAFHSASMDDVLAPFVQAFDGIVLSPPVLPYVSNVTGDWITVQQATSPAYYADHLRRAVRFSDGVHKLAGDAAMQLLEVGPGQALTSLARLTLGAAAARRVLPSMPRANDKRTASQAVAEATGALWLAGVPVRWDGLHEGAQPRRVPLPTYPFERSRHWVAAATPAGLAVAAPAAPAPVRRPLDDWFFAPSWLRGFGASTGRPAALAGRWAVLAQPCALTDAVHAALRSAGASTIAVERGDRFARLGEDRFMVRQAAADDFADVVRASASGIAGVLHLWALGAAEAPDAASLHDTLLAIGAGWATAAPDAALRVLHACCGSESVLEEQALSAQAASALGPVLVLPTELPGLRMRTVDVDAACGALDAQAVARALVEEAALEDDEPIVARRAGRRWLRRFEPVTLPEVQPALVPLRRNGVVWITGGLGGIGLAIARWLGEHCAARVLLTSRSGLPEREHWDEPRNPAQAAAIAAIRAMEASGGEVLVVAADASDEAAMSRALKAATERWGPVNAVIHAAGVSGSGSIALRKSAEQTRAVLAPKVEGLRVLTRLLGGQPLDLVALMGSINGVIGAPGTSDYASANAVLDAFADSAERPAGWKHVVALDWSAWREVGMAANLPVPASERAQWQAYLATAIGTADGVEAFRRAIASGLSRLVVAPYDLPQVIADRRIAGRQGAQAAPATAASAASAPAPSNNGSLAPRPALANAFEAPASGLEQQVACVFGDLLGIEGVGADDDFFELGGHSLLATRVLARLEGIAGVRLALRDVFDAPTVRALAARAAALHGQGRAGAAEEDREEIEF